MCKVQIVSRTLIIMSGILIILPRLLIIMSLILIVMSGILTVMCRIFMLMAGISIILSGILITHAVLSRRPKNFQTMCTMYLYLQKIKWNFWAPGRVECL
jgi:hypothetical protein